MRRNVTSSSRVPFSPQPLVFPPVEPLPFFYPGLLLPALLGAPAARLLRARQLPRHLPLLQLPLSPWRRLPAPSVLLVPPLDWSRGPRASLPTSAPRRSQPSGQGRPCSGDRLSS